MEKIIFSSADKKINIVARKNYKRFIAVVFKNEKIKLNQVRFIFCSDKYLQNINRIYLNHDYLTDVITFLLSKPNEPIVSEVYMSIDRIKENAKSYSVSYQNELLRVMLHGCLHLCGYEDNTASCKEQIRIKEDYFLKLYLEFSRET